eukprot:1248351-Rhodomonas_salina.2
MSVTLSRHDRSAFPLLTWTRSPGTRHGEAAGEVTVGVKFLPPCPVPRSRVPVARRRACECFKLPVEDLSSRLPGGASTEPDTQAVTVTQRTQARSFESKALYSSPDCQWPGRCPRATARVLVARGPATQAVARAVTD